MEKKSSVCVIRLIREKVVNLVQVVKPESVVTVEKAAESLVALAEAMVHMVVLVMRVMQVLAAFPVSYQVLQAKFLFTKSN